MRRLPLIPLVLALAVLAGWSAAAPDPAVANGCPLRSSQGTAGTAEDPILIPDRAALETLAANDSCYASAYVFRQTADVDLSGGAWTPIAVPGTDSFDGVYDGGGHRISGLVVTGGTRGVGLFASLNRATVRHLVIVAPDVAAGQSGTAAGALAGDAIFSEIENVVVAGGRVAGNDTVGGLLGAGCYSRIAASSASAAVSGAIAVGGLIGSQASACVGSLGDIGAAVPAPSFAVGIFDSSASGAVSGDYRVGGLAGRVEGGSLQRAWASGAVTAVDAFAGGLVGTLRSGYVINTPSAPDEVVEDVYATGAVTIERSDPGGAGGLVGVIDPSTTVTRAYATGRVSAAMDAGGLVGAALMNCVGVGASICTAEIGASTASSAFWDVGTTGRTTTLDGYGVGRSTAQMQEIGTYAEAGWSITRGYSAAATWAICPTANGGYPFLTGAYAASTQPCAGTPAKPAKVTVTSGDGEVTLSWQPPTGGDGGSPVTGYTATATMQRQAGRAGRSCTVAATKRSCTITGLVNGRAYRVALTADNLEGAGTPAVRTVTPRRAMAVLSTARSGLAVITRVRVREAGRLTQVGTVAGLGARACRTTSAVRRAGVVELRCALAPAALAALAARDLDVRVVTRFAPTAGERRSAVRRVAFARTDAAGAVTG